jgi:hypothetical protein
MIWLIFITSHHLTHTQWQALRRGEGRGERRYKPINKVGGGGGLAGERIQATVTDYSNVTSHPVSIRVQYLKKSFLYRDATQSANFKYEEDNMVCVSQSKNI